MVSERSQTQRPHALPASPLTLSDGITKVCHHAQINLLFVSVDLPILSMSCKWNPGVGMSLARNRKETTAVEVARTKVMRTEVRKTAKMQNLLYDEEPQKLWSRDKMYFFSQSKSHGHS